MKIQFENFNSLFFIWLRTCPTHVSEIHLFSRKLHGIFLLQFWTMQYVEIKPKTRLNYKIALRIGKTHLSAIAFIFETLRCQYLNFIQEMRCIFLFCSKQTSHRLILAYCRSGAHMHTPHTTQSNVGIDQNTSLNKQIFYFCFLLFIVSLQNHWETHRTPFHVCRIASHDKTDINRMHKTKQKTNPHHTIPFFIIQKSFIIIIKNKNETIQ